jgi:uncharacterized protein
MKKLFKTPSGDLRWGWKTALLLFGTLAFGVFLSTALITALTVSYSSQGLAQEQAMENAALASGGFVAQVILSVLQLGFMLWLVRWLIVRIEKKNFSWSELGFQDHDRSQYIRLGVLLAIALSVLTIAIGMFTGTLRLLDNGFALFPAAQVLITLMLSGILALASGFGEEIAFRGYLQSRITARYNATVAVIIVAVFFALSHPVTDVDNPLLYMITAVMVGILFGMIFARTGSLWMSIALHTAWNYVQIAVLAVRNSPDERFFGAPLFVFENISATTQAILELAVVSAAVLFVLWLATPRTSSLTY